MYADDIEAQERRSRKAQYPKYRPRDLFGSREDNLFAPPPQEGNLFPSARKEGHLFSSSNEPREGNLFPKAAEMGENLFSSVKQDEEMEDGDAEASQSEGPSLLSRVWQTKLVEFGNNEPQKNEETYGNEGLPYGDIIQPLSYAADASDAPEDRSTQNKPDAVIIRQGDSSALRPNAIYITSEEMQDLNTEKVMDLFMRYLVNPRALGMEWIDDASVAVIFNSAADIPRAIELLSGENFDVDDPLAYHYVSVFPSRLKPFFVRAALASDVKKREAYKESRFYQKHRTPYSRDDRWRSGDDQDYGRRRDRAGPHRSDRRGRGRNNREVPDKDQLEKELDDFLKSRPEEQEEVATL